MSKPINRWTDKYSNRTAVAVEDYKLGIEGTTVDPTAEAIKKSGDWHAKVSSPDAKTKFEQGLKFAGKEGWQKGALEKGVTRYPAGVQAGLHKYVDFANKFKVHIDANAGKIKAMPKTNLEQSVAKAAAQIRSNALFRYKK